MSAITSIITRNSTDFPTDFIAHSKKINKGPHYRPFATGCNRWITVTNSHLYGKCFHVMTSSRLRHHLINLTARVFPSSAHHAPITPGVFDDHRPLAIFRIEGRPSELGLNLKKYSTVICLCIYVYARGCVRLYR